MRRIFPSESGGKKLHSRKNNEHWTREEVKKLIRGVRRYGEGRWTKVKRHYFSSSVREPTHLKVCMLREYKLAYMTLLSVWKR